MKFKAGDKVKIVGRRSAHAQNNYGVTTTIRKLSGHTDNVCVLETEDPELEGGVWFEDIELVEETSKQDDSMGIRLNSGKIRWRNFPMFLIEPMVEVGAKAEKHPSNPEGKYETYNFLKGMYVCDTLDSMKRHLMKFESPYESDLDHESQCSHLAHIAWNALVALHMLKTRPELDDRFKLPETKSEEPLTYEEQMEAVYTTAKKIQDGGR